MDVENEQILNVNPADPDNLSDSLFSGDEENTGTEEIKNEINGNWISASSINEARINAKAKRRLRKNSSRDSGRGDSVSDNGSDALRGGVTVPTSPKGRLLDRRSRSGKGRGLPKKGGAGGKGVWGTPGQVYDVEEVDVKDPNYDDDQENCVYETVVLPLDERAFEKTLTPIIQEYFEHGDTNEVAEMLRDLNLGEMKSGVPVLAVSLALEGKASHREMTSKLLSDLCGTVMSTSDVEKSFDKLLKDLPELALDTPRAPQLVGQFIARAVGDGILCNTYIDSYKGTVDCVQARAALDKATVLLSMSKGGKRKDNVWGSGGGQQSVNHLVKEIDMLLKEYLLSGDISEAEHCLKELEVPHFHHELVYEAIIMVLESTGESTFKMILDLLKSLWMSSTITVDQMKRGYERIYNEIPDINLDVPHSYSVLERFVEECFQAGIISKQLRDLCPSRGRKRFVSEGDGGRLKPESY
ncbi:programmed cell death protein 4 [Cebus imitator]|uniref:Programmed cell death protein 4 n=2 Tax=Cebinae TaxID=38070 RepID=A0A2K5RFU4_CEBIM|nr:programmed cell death protein 4 [Cebus imitator]XP_017355169.1 programmed cell death protein 4 [Cebus imitator]XP_032137493.1 programmed cell death protein 4 [Sapajus apella]XP_032137494.1 programmed cell death protein 4 [Sapajus apella]XP_032137495.1 programmed cell death protein 4 [Sapajus apella]XP_032137496.1 programmed cell death protein 4 [Sapajus apella]XP_032137497.1 programmed cell death protein 4 [Sapajus apella]XP_032137498.1 programmed cell death protein 4 [Sapajus apella]